MEKQQLAIPKAHGDAIKSRMEQIQQSQYMMQVTLPAVVQVLVGEDKRHVDAVMRSMNYDPDAYSTYDLVQKDGNWLLELTPKPEPEKVKAEAA
jgi:hypothetical protein